MKLGLMGGLVINIHPHTMARIEQGNLHSHISVTDRVKINKQDRSIGTGPLYVHTKVEVN